MPKFVIEVAGELTSEQRKELYKKVAIAIMEVKECPEDAISGSIIELPFDCMGKGLKTWGEILEN